MQPRLPRRLPPLHTNLLDVDGAWLSRLERLACTAEQRLQQLLDEPRARLDSAGRGWSEQLAEAGCTQLLQLCTLIGERPVVQVPNRAGKPASLALFGWQRRSLSPSRPPETRGSLVPSPG